MTSREELQARLEFRLAALEEARAAYLDILRGRAASYAIGTRNITKHNLDELWDIIRDMEKEVDSLKVSLNGGARRKSVGAVIRDW